MDMHQLKIFKAVFEHKSFSEAAQKIYLTQPTVSGHIKALEESLGVTLFERTSKEVTPTKAGEFLYPYAKNLLNGLSEAKKAMEAFVSGQAGTLRIGGSNIPGTYILPKLIGLFKQNRAEVKISLQISDTSEIKKQVMEREIELGIIGAPVSEQELSCEPCFEDKMVIICPKGHRFCKNDTIDFHELQNEPFVMREQGSGSRLMAEDAIKASGYDGFHALNVVAEIGSTEALCQAVKTGVGLSIVSARAVQEDLDTGILCATQLKNIDFTRRFYIITVKKGVQSPVCNDFLQFLKENSSV